MGANPLGYGRVGGGKEIWRWKGGLLTWCECCSKSEKNIIGIDVISGILSIKIILFVQWKFTRI